MTVEALGIAEATAEDRAVWDDFVSSAANAEAGHRWDFGDCLAGVFGLRPVRLLARRGNAVAAALPLVLQRSFLGTFLTSVPYLNYAGIVGTDTDARIALAVEARRLAGVLRADRLEIRGRDGSDLPIEQWTGKATYRLRLPSRKEDLWQSIGSKVRSQVKRPSKEGYGARVDPTARDRFHLLLARRWRELGSPVLPGRFFEKLEGAFRDDLTYVVVERGSETVAAGALLSSGSCVEIPWAASHKDHDRFGVNMLLYWASLEHAIGRGARQFDFGRSTPGTGNARFKLQWGAGEQALSWNVLASGGRGKAHEHGDVRRGLAAAAWRRLPLALTTRFGPWLAARIPY